jgi:hypothetical protein
VSLLIEELKKSQNNLEHVWIKKKEKKIAKINKTKIKFEFAKRK